MTYRNLNDEEVRLADQNPDQPEPEQKEGFVEGRDCPSCGADMQGMDGCSTPDCDNNPETEDEDEFEDFDDDLDDDDDVASGPFDDFPQGHLGEGKDD